MLRIVFLLGIVLGTAALFSIAAGILARARQAPPRTDLELALFRHVSRLASPTMRGRAPGTPENAQARDELAAQLQAIGLRAPSGGFLQTIDPQVGDNVLGLRLGTRRPQEWILVLAHFDHLGESEGSIYAGADDNASAVAIVLEALRMLPADGLGRSLLAAFPNSEEPPYFLGSQMGSEYLASHLPPEIGAPENIYAVVVLDLMGGSFWKPLESTIFAIGSEKSPHIESTIVELQTPRGLDVRRMGLHLVEEIPGQGHHPFSDYDAFRNRDVPFLFLSSGRTPNYHQPTDTPDTLNYPRMALSARYLADLLAGLAASDRPRSFEAEREDYRRDLEALAPLLAEASNPLYTVPGTSGLSWLRLLRDRWSTHGLEQKLKRNEALSEEDILELRRASFRLQCLLAGYSGCFAL